MGPTEINGLPAHPLLVHLVIALVPLAAVAVVLVAVWPAVRRRIGVVAPLLALAALVAVPVTTHAGEVLERRLGGSPLIARHAHLGGQLLPWVVALFVVATAQWAWLRHTERAEVRRADTVSAGPAISAGGGTALAVRPQAATGQRVITVVLTVVAVVVAVVAVWMLYRIGDSGARAVWSGIG